MKKLSKWRLLCEKVVKMVCGCLQTMRGAICSRMVPTRVSGTPWGSVLNHFSVLLSKCHRITRRCLQTMRGAICSRTVPTRVSGTPWGSLLSHFCVLHSRPVPSRPVPSRPLPSQYQAPGHPRISRGDRSTANCAAHLLKASAYSFDHFFV